MIRRVLSLPGSILLAPFLLAAPAAAQQLERPELALDVGPVVCFSKNAGGSPRQTDLYVANCDGERGAQRFCRVQGNVRIVTRLDRSHFLLACYDQPYGLVVVDAATGVQHLLADGSPHDFVALHGGDVLYLGDDRWGKGDHFLYARPWRGGERRKLTEVQLDAVPIVDGNLAIAVTAGEREVWKVSLTRGAGSRVHRLPEGTMSTRLALSPGGQRLAIGCNQQGRGRLTVVDLATGKALQVWKTINITVSPLSSSLPRLEVGWHDDGHVVTAETIGNGRNGGHFAFVRRSIASGEVVEELDAGDLGLSHPQPPTPGAPAAEPLFSVQPRGDRYLLLRADRERPVAEAANVRGRACPLAVSPDGAYAVEQLERDPTKRVLHRRTGPPLALFDQPCTDLCWFGPSR
ncbi:MAG: YncE family protein [Planctomycetota bacterium]